MYSFQYFLVLLGAACTVALPQGHLVTRGDPSLADYTQSVANGGNLCIDLVKFTLACVKNQCDSWHPQVEDDWISLKTPHKQRDLASLLGHEESAEKRSSPDEEKGLMIVETAVAPQKRADERNKIPEWVMCSYSDGSFPVTIPKGKIIAAIARGMQLWQTNQQTPPNRSGRQYPHQYKIDPATPDLLHADRNILMEFPVFPSGSVYAAGEPSRERVIFDQCGEFVAVMSHRMTDDNRLFPCWIVDRDGNRIGPGPDVAPMRADSRTPNIVNPLQPGAGVPLAWLGLPNNAPYPDPDAW